MQPRRADCQLRSFCISTQAEGTETVTDTLCFEENRSNKWFPLVSFGTLELRVFFEKKLQLVLLVQKSQQEKEKTLPVKIIHKRVLLFCN